MDIIPVQITLDKLPTVRKHMDSIQTLNVMRSRRLQVHAILQPFFSEALKVSCEFYKLARDHKKEVFRLCSDDFPADIKDIIRHASDDEYIAFLSKYAKNPIDISVAEIEIARERCRQASIAQHVFDSDFASISTNRFSLRSIQDVQTMMSVYIRMNDGNYTDLRDLQLTYMLSRHVDKIIVEFIFEIVHQHPLTPCVYQLAEYTFWIKCRIRIPTGLSIVTWMPVEVVRRRFYHLLAKSICTSSTKVNRQSFFSFIRFRDEL